MLQPEERIENLEKLMAQSQLMYQGLVVEMTKGYKKHDESLARHDKILANLSANQIVIGKAMDGIHNDVNRLIDVFNKFVDIVGNKFQDHEERINKLEGQ